MHGHVFTLIHKLRFLAIAAFIVTDLFLLSLLPAALGPTGKAATPRTQTTLSAAAPQLSNAYENPNAVAVALTNTATTMGRTARTLGYQAGSVSRTILLTTGKSSMAVLKGVGTGVAFAGRSMHAAAVFTGRTTITIAVFVVRVPGNVLGFVSSTASASALTRPSSNAKLPVIDPNKSVATPPAPQPKVQAAAVQPAPPIATEPQWPIHGQITTLFGVPHWPYQPVHTGLDISSGQPSGVTPIHPCKPGRVTEVIQSSSGLGNHVTVDHGGGAVSVYGHMYSIAVQTGQIVDKNTILGFEGSTGASTGTHLHFEIWINGQMTDPLTYVPGRP